MLPMCSKLQKRPIFFVTSFPSPLISLIKMACSVFDGEDWIGVIVVQLVLRPPAMIVKGPAHFNGVIGILWLQVIRQLLRPTGKIYSHQPSFLLCSHKIDFSLPSTNLSTFNSNCSIQSILISVHMAGWITICVSFQHFPPPSPLFNQIESKREKINHNTLNQR